MITLVPNCAGIAAAMFDTIDPTGGYGIYAMALAGLTAAYAGGRWLSERRAADRHRQAQEAHSEPVSLHPVIDPARCIGCGACTNACPEGKILGLIGGKAELVDPAACVGHGACKSACPTGAIDLVFGTARRGVEIPHVSPTFESSVPGLFIAGELGGMGLIANAVEQGRQAIEAIRRLDGLGSDACFDVVIVGAGPAGIAASLAARQHGLTCATLEQDTIGGSVARYPRAKLVMTRPARLPLYGKVQFRRVRKERLIALWDSVIARTGIEITSGVRVERVLPKPDGGFVVETTAGRYHTRSVLLATGRRGSPRRLDVPGEAATKVVYALADPAQYAGRHVLVVGGGDSALEAVLALVRQPVASLTLCHRGAAFQRARPALQARLQKAVADRRVGVLLDARVLEIGSDRVMLDVAGRRQMVANDDVVVCIGGLLPTALLAAAGVRVDVKYGAA